MIKEYLFRSDSICSSCTKCKETFPISDSLLSIHKKDLHLTGCGLLRLVLSDSSADTEYLLVSVLLLFDLLS